MTHPTKQEETVPTFTELDYIADLLYQHHSRTVEGYATGVRWWCHRPDGETGRLHWRKEAERAYREWAAAEQQTLEQQEKKHGRR